MKEGVVTDSHEAFQHGCLVVYHELQYFVTGTRSRQVSSHERTHRESIRIPLLNRSIDLE